MASRHTGECSPCLSPSLHAGRDRAQRSAQPSHTVLASSGEADAGAAHESAAGAALAFEFGDARAHDAALLGGQRLAGRSLRTRRLLSQAETMRPEPQSSALPGPAVAPAGHGEGSLFSPAPGGFSAPPRFRARADRPHAPSAHLEVQQERSADLHDVRCATVATPSVPVRPTLEADSPAGHVARALDADFSAITDADADFSLEAAGAKRMASLADGRAAKRAQSAASDISAAAFLPQIPAGSGRPLVTQPASVERAHRHFLGSDMTGAVSLGDSEERASVRAPGFTFTTGLGRPVVPSAASLARARQLIATVEVDAGANDTAAGMAETGEDLLIGHDRPAALSEVAHTRARAAMAADSASTSTTAVDGPPTFVSGSGRPITVSAAGLERARQLLLETEASSEAGQAAPSPNPPPTFTTGHGRPLAVSAASLSRARQLLDDPSSDMAEAPAAALPTFTTGLGRAVAVSAASLERARRVLGADDEVSAADEQAPVPEAFPSFSTGNGRPVSVSAASMVRARQLIEPDAASAGDSITPAVPPNPSFTTGNGRPVTVSAASLARARQLVEQESQGDEGFARGPDRAMTGLTTGNGRPVEISAAGLARARQLMADADQEEPPAIPSAMPLFTTGHGRPVQVSAPSLARARQILEAESSAEQPELAGPPAVTGESAADMPTFTTGRGRPLTVSAAGLARARELMAKDEPASVDDFGTDAASSPAAPPLRSAPTKPVVPPADLAARADTRQPSVTPAGIRGARATPPTTGRTVGLTPAANTPLGPPAPLSTGRSLGARGRIVAGAQATPLASGLSKLAARGSMEPPSAVPEKRRRLTFTSPRPVLRRGAALPSVVKKAAPVAAVFPAPPPPPSGRPSLLAFSRQAGTPLLSRAELLAAGVPPAVVDTTAANAAAFRFADGRGAESVRDALLAMGAASDRCSAEWVANHFRWVVWKLAAQTRRFPQLPIFTFERVVLQLARRYYAEAEQAKRSCLQLVLEQDSSAGSHMVLCVAAVREDRSLELTDGWYGMPADLDEALLRALDRGALFSGQKLHVIGAQLEGSACAPLEPHSSKLKL
jgi:hypothetical protein